VHMWITCMTKLVQFYVLILHVLLIKIVQEKSFFTGTRGSERGDCKVTSKTNLGSGTDVCSLRLRWFWVFGGVVDYGPLPRLGFHYLFSLFSVSSLRC
jgi:hypothetical protein